MIQKILISATAVIVLAGISLFAAEKAKEKRAAEKQEMRAQEGDWQHHGPLLDELIAAYKANDREKMGQVIQKMEQRREKMQKFARLNRWHKWAHRRMDMRSRDWGQAEREAQRTPGWGGLQRPGCCEAQRSPGWGCCQRDGWGPPAREYRQMPGFDRGQRQWREGMDGHGRGDWTPGPEQRFDPEFNPERQRMPGFGPYGGERPMPPRDNPSPDMDW